MTAEELYEIVTQDFDNDIIVDNIHPLHKAMLEECCESAINNKQKIEDLNTLKYSAQIAFITTLNTLRGTLKGVLELGDTINLNYRNQTFVIEKNSPLLK